MSDRLFSDCCYGTALQHGASQPCMMEESDCQHCDGFGAVWNNGDPASRQWVPCDVCKDERGHP